MQFCEIPEQEKPEEYGGEEPGNWLHNDGRNPQNSNDVQFVPIKYLYEAKWVVQTRQECMHRQR